MVRMFSVVALLGLGACEIEEIGTGTGMITVKNEDAKDYAIVISDNDQCLLGLKTKLENNTQTTYSVGENSFFCLSEGGTGVKVHDGKTYHVKGGQLAETR